MLFMAGFLFARRDDISDIIDDMLSHPAMITIAGIISLLLGLAIIITHNIWAMDWRVAVTLLGCLSLVQGIIRLYFPWFIKDKAAKLMRTASGYWITVAIVLVWGVYLTYHGFSATSLMLPH